MAADAAVLKRLSPRQGKVLRYIVSTRDLPVAPDRLIVSIEWSDLPHTDMQARRAIGALHRLGLVKRIDKNAYEPTDAGREAIKLADKEDMWRKPPPPAKTNNFLYRGKGGKDK
jgi:hypothetical protein